MKSLIDYEKEVKDAKSKLDSVYHRKHSEVELIDAKINYYNKRDMFNQNQADMKAEIAYHEDGRFKPNRIQRMFGMTEDCVRKRHEKRCAENFGY